MDDYIHKKVIRVPIYGGKFIIIFSDSVELTKKAFPDFDKTHTNAWTYKSFYRNYRAVYIIIDIKHPCFTFGVFAHEAFHMSNFIFNRLGIKLDYENDESMAYFIDWITVELHKFYNKVN